MLNKLLAFIRRYELVQPGDRIVCALSGGADSVAMLFAFYLLKEKLDIRLTAAHFNHRLRGEESDADEAFVRALCGRYDIPLAVGSGEVTPGKKGLEAAAREARYGFLESLPGKIATAHTANDNAETVLLHLVRGTGLKGLGAIAPSRGRIIRPMLSVTRQEVLDFLSDYGLSYRTDSSNETDAFLRNRLRHHVFPLLAAENPRLAEDLSEMALGLRLDEALLSEQSQPAYPLDIQALRAMHPARRSRVLERFLKDSGVPEPERSHIRLAEDLVFSEKPSARASLPGGVLIGRSYGTLEVLSPGGFAPVTLPCPGVAELPELGLRLICEEAGDNLNTPTAYTLSVQGGVTVRPRQPGDTIRLSGGTKSLKKLFIDRKLPASSRGNIPILADSLGVLAVYGIGANLDRIGEQPAWRLRFENIER